MHQPWVSQRQDAPAPLGPGLRPGMGSLQTPGSDASSRPSHTTSSKYVLNKIRMILEEINETRDYLQKQDTFPGSTHKVG